LTTQLPRPEPSWTAIVPFKPAHLRKTRLAPVLSSGARIALTARLFHHVIEILHAAPMIAEIAVLGAEPIPGWNGPWIADAGRGLNLELQAARDSLAGARLLVIHADLPLVTPADIAQLLQAAGPAGAIAPDRHRDGTNALALHAQRDFSFAFGPASFQRHLDAMPGAAIVSSAGLALDIDTPADLAFADRQGFHFAAE
jgi:2-phospho-L-lactate guanylyltransferase